MRNPAVTTKTSAQIAADFDAVFASIKPLPKTRPGSLATRLAPHRQTILRHRRRGLTWTEIAAWMAGADPHEKVTAKTLQKLFGTLRKTPAPPPRG